MKRLFFAALCSIPLIVGCRDDSEINKETLAKEFLEIEEAKVLAKKMMAEKEVFEVVRNFIEKNRAGIDSCCDSFKQKNCICEHSWAIEEDEYVQERAWLNSEAKNPNEIRLKLRSTDFGKCDKKIIIFSKSGILQIDKDCQELFTKYGIE